MKKLHPTHGIVTVVKALDDKTSLVKLANGVETCVTTEWLTDVPAESSSAPEAK